MYIVIASKEVALDWWVFLQISIEGLSIEVPMGHFTHGSLADAYAEKIGGQMMSAQLEYPNILKQETEEKK